jgi:hypothetical protein
MRTRMGARLGVGLYGLFLVAAIALACYAVLAPTRVMAASDQRNCGRCSCRKVLHSGDVTCYLESCELLVGPPGCAFSCDYVCPL